MSLEAVDQSLVDMTRPELSIYRVDDAIAITEARSPRKRRASSPPTPRPDLLPSASHALQDAATSASPLPQKRNRAAQAHASRLTATPAAVGPSPRATINSAWAAVSATEPTPVAALPVPSCLRTVTFSTKSPASVLIRMVYDNGSSTDSAPCSNDPQQDAEKLRQASDAILQACQQHFDELQIIEARRLNILASILSRYADVSRSPNGRRDKTKDVVIQLTITGPNLSDDRFFSTLFCPVSTGVDFEPLDASILHANGDRDVRRLVASILFFSQHRLGVDEAWLSLGAMPTGGFVPGSVLDRDFVVRTANHQELDNNQGVKSSSIATDQQLFATFAVEAIAAGLAAQAASLRHWLAEGVSDPILPVNRATIERSGTNTFVVILRSSTAGRVSFRLDNAEDAIAVRDKADELCAEVECEMGRDFARSAEGMKECQRRWCRAVVGEDVDQAVERCERIAWICEHDHCSGTGSCKKGAWDYASPSLRCLATDTLTFFFTGSHRCRGTRCLHDVDQLFACCDLQDGFCRAHVLDLIARRCRQPRYVTDTYWRDVQTYDLGRGVALQYAAVRESAASRTTLVWKSETVAPLPCHRSDFCHQRPRQRRLGHWRREAKSRTHSSVSTTTEDGDLRVRHHELQ